jgi:hypothetical protein
MEITMKAYLSSTIGGVIKSTKSKKYNSKLLTQWFFYRKPLSTLSLDIIILPFNEFNSLPRLLFSKGFSFPSDCHLRNEKKGGYLIIYGFVSSCIVVPM